MARVTAISFLLAADAIPPASPLPAANFIRRRAAVVAGVADVRINFPQTWNRWWFYRCRDTACDAAALRLLMDFRGSDKPTGNERTWPGILTRGGVRRHQRHMTGYTPLRKPAHSTNLPFTRYPAAAGDCTLYETEGLQGNTREHEPAQMGHVLATFVFRTLILVIH